MYSVIQCFALFVISNLYLCHHLTTSIAWPWNFVGPWGLSPGWDWYQNLCFSYFRPKELLYKFPIFSITGCWKTFDNIPGLTFYWAKISFPHFVSSLWRNNSVMDLPIDIIWPVAWWYPRRFLFWEICKVPSRLHATGSYSSHVIVMKEICYWVYVPCY